MSVMAKRLYVQDPLGREVGLGPGGMVLDGNSAHLPKKGHSSPPHFSVHVYCGQTAGWIRMPLGMEVGLGPVDIVRWEPTHRPYGAQQPLPLSGPRLLYSQTAVWSRMPLGIRMQASAETTLC